MVELKHLQKVIGQNTVVEIEALAVSAGEIAAIVGPAGSGETALFDLLLGRTRPTMGTVQVAGIDPAQDKHEFSQRVGVLFAEDSLYKNRPPLANLEFQCQLYGLPKARALEVLRQVGLADHANTSIEKLPPGMARRLAFGRAILHNPKVLLLVEPFTRCDESSIAVLGDLIRQQADHEVTVLILSADNTYLAPLCDAIYSLNQGRIVESRRPQEEGRPELPFKIPVRMEEKVVLFNPADILYAEAEEGRAFIVTAEGRFPTQFTLAELEGRLACSRAPTSTPTASPPPTAAPTRTPELVSAPRFETAPCPFVLPEGYVQGESVDWRGRCSWHSLPTRPSDRVMPASLTWVI